MLRRVLGSFFAAQLFLPVLLRFLFSMVPRTGIANSSVQVVLRDTGVDLSKILGGQTKILGRAEGGIKFGAI